MSFIHKHTPTAFNDLVFDNDAIRRRVGQYVSGQRWDNILLHGPAGTGKTSCAGIIASSQFSASGADTLLASFNAATLATTEAIVGEWNFQRLNGIAHPYVVLNEVDQLSKMMQQKLRSMLDEYTCGKIIFTTNNRHLVDGPLADRCDNIEMPSATSTNWLVRAKEILAAEQVTITDKQIEALLKTTNGSIRDLMRGLEDVVLARV